MAAQTASINPDSTREPHAVSVKRLGLANDAPTEHSFENGVRIELKAARE
jgi:hypothetical protein